MGLLQNLVELSNDPSCFFREKQVSAWVIQYIFSICSKVLFEKYTLPTTTEELRSIADCVKAAPWIYPGAWGFGRHFSRWCHFAFTIQDLSCRHKRRQRVWLWMYESNHRHRQQTAKNDQGSTTACHGVLKRSRESRDFPFFFAYLFEVLAANPQWS